MADSNFLNYKGKPLVRKGNEIYYGDMSEPFIIRFQMLSDDINGKVTVQLLDSNTDLNLKDRTKKESTKDTLFDALDLGFTWLERALKS